jgi:hypothetical protein
MKRTASYDVTPCTSDGVDSEPLLNCRGRSPLCGADKHSTAKEIHMILQNPEVHHRIHNTGPPAHTLPPHFLKIYFNWPSEYYSLGDRYQRFGVTC